MLEVCSSNDALTIRRIVNWNFIVNNNTFEYPLFCLPNQPKVLFMYPVHMSSEAQISSLFICKRPFWLYSLRPDFIFV
jgi:hypothetical protein